MDGHQVAMNRTRALEALSPYLENPRQIVIRNEAFVAVAAAMLLLQFILGPWRRRSGHWFVQGTLWVAYTGSFPLITYTLGQMVTSPVKNMLYPFWAVILTWAAGCTNASMAYNIEDNKRWKRYLFEILQYLLYLAFILKLFDHGASASSHPIGTALLLLANTVSYAHLFRVAAGWRVTNSSPSKLVADYMRAQVQVNTTYSAAHDETFSMNDCKYLVQGEPRYAITIEEIWGITFHDDSLLKKQLRDVCLSFALSRLLLRRYFQMDCAEAGLSKTLEFALKGLLLEEDRVNHYSRAFNVLEVELGFLYDLFFTKHAALFSLEGLFLGMVIIKLTSASIVAVGTRRGDVIVTVVIMVALRLFEVLEAILYLTSDWATVVLACSYARGDTCKLIKSIIRFVRRFMFDNFHGRRINLFGYWQNKIGQSSVIGGNLFVHLLYVSHPEGFEILLKLPVYALPYNLIYSMSEIVSCLRIYGNVGGPLTNGKAALERNGILGDFSSTLENDSQIKVMLIWHIATEYRNIASSDGAEEGLQSDEQQVATTLSKYCAYLMYFLPELLVENSTDTLFIVHDLLKEVQSALGSGKPTKNKLLRVIQDSESIRGNQDQTVDHVSDDPDNHVTLIDIPPVVSNTDDIIQESSGSSNNNDATIAQDSGTNNNEDGIFIQGLKLGMKLEEKGVSWKVMAEFWAETIIYIAPSDKATEHMERLAQGGEFLTHVWALLTHAGIVKRDQVVPKLEQTPIPDARV
ncbi:hypothetical protein VPH35_032955 [Triticum aestivum]